MYRPTFNVDGKFRTALFSFWGCSLAILLTSSMCLDAAVSQNDRITGSDIPPVNCSHYDNRNEDHRSSAATLNHLCELCHAHFRQPILYTKCKSNCYKNDVFPACVKTLEKWDEVENFQRMIVRFNGGDANAQINAPYETIALPKITYSFNERYVTQDSWEFGPQRFKEFGCMGSYDKYIFGKIDRMCYDCARLYEPHDEMYIECRKECYTTIYYPACLESLKYGSENELIHYKALIEDFSGYKFIEWGSSNVSKLGPTKRN